MSAASGHSVIPNKKLKPLCMSHVVSEFESVVSWRSLGLLSSSPVSVDGGENVFLKKVATL